jgi:outer membrane receptor protein involved in Fe transport
MKFKSTHLAVAIGLALLPAAYVSAQTAPGDTDKKDAATASTDPVNLEGMIVTGTPTATSKMNSSVSVSTEGPEKLQLSSPGNVAAVLSTIPGIHAEASGGEGNANLTVRGLPISAGGSRYVQYQEDGLPILQFGDIAFATPDEFMRVDSSLDHLEVVRGGSASTLATNSPGGIVNFITKTGDEEGGSVGIGHGLDFDRTRVDFDYGGKINDTTRYYVSAYYRAGEGTRDSNTSVESGGQLRANITHDLDDNGSFIRFSLKHLDDQAPTYLPVPVVETNGSLQPAAGIDPRTASFYSKYFAYDSTLNENNGYTRSKLTDGLRVKDDSIGFEGSFQLGGGWQLDDKFRYSSNSGRFAGIYPSSPAQPASSFAQFAGTYLTGPNAGQAYTGNAFVATTFNTKLNDLDNIVNDLRLTRRFELAADSTLDLTGGLYYSDQHVGLTWNFNQYLLSAVNEGAALLNTKGTTTGLVAADTDVFGGCCSRFIDAKYRTTSPYFDAIWSVGSWTIDGSVRHDDQQASGNYNQAVDHLYAAANSQKIDYDVDHNSYSIGANYRIDKNLAVFARVSSGVSFNADRIMFGSANLDGGVIPLNTVKQNELGVKWREGGFSSFVTLFEAKTAESNYDATTQISTSNRYDAKGVEIETSYTEGGFNITGGLTYTHSRVTGALTPNLIGTTPNRLAKYIYQIVPSYTFGDWVIGGSIIGTTKSQDQQPTPITLPGYATLNLFASYQITPSLLASVSANNLTNKIGYTEADNANAARSIDGRTLWANLRYKF